jgi:hypothetical protein
MVSLASVHDRFEVPVTVIEGGSGVVRGVLSEAEQNSQPTYVFAHPRRVFRVKPNSLVKTGMVVRTPAGETLLVGENGPSESWRGVLWKSFRMFSVSKQVLWQKRNFAIDPITQIKRDIGLSTGGHPWMVLEAVDREVNDGRLRRSFEQVRFITGADVQADDLIEGKVVSKCDNQLGLRVGFLI